MTDEIRTVPDQCVHSTEAVLPVVVAEVAVEGVVEQCPGGLWDGWFQIGGVRDL